MTDLTTKEPISTDNLPADEGKLVVADSPSIDVQNNLSPNRRQPGNLPTDEGEETLVDTTHTHAAPAVEPLTEDEQQGENLSNPPEKLEERTPETTPTISEPVQLEKLTEDEQQERNELEPSPISMDDLPADERPLGTTIPIAETDQFEKLTEDEQQERNQLEKDIKQSLLLTDREYFKIGSALRKMRDGKLYRSSHKTFEAYCFESFGIHRRHCYELIAGVKVRENLCANGAQILPTAESQVRPLTSVSEEEQISYWNEAVDESGGKVPTRNTVKNVVEKRKKKQSTNNNSCQIDEVYILTKLEGTDKKYNGFPAIVKELRKDYTVSVDVYDKTLFVKPSNLKRAENVSSQLPQIRQRIKHLLEHKSLPPFAKCLLELLGKQTEICSSCERVLRWLEQEYGVAQDGSA